MSHREHPSETGLGGAFESQPRSLPAGAGSSPALSNATPSTHRRPPQHLLDQRRHTVDYSAWATQGAFDQFVSVERIVTHRAAVGSDLPSKHDTMASAWSSHSSESLDTHETDSAISLGDKQRSSNRLYPNASSQQQQYQHRQQQHSSSGATACITDTFGRRASMSQLSFYGGVWDQVCPMFAPERGFVLPVLGISTFPTTPSLPCSQSITRHMCMDTKNVPRPVSFDSSYPTLVKRLLVLNVPSIGVVISSSGMTEYSIKWFPLCPRVHPFLL